MLLKFRMLSKLPTQRILVRTVAVIAGSLQFAGFVVSSLDDIAGIYIAFAGCCIFRVLAAVVLTVIVTYGKIRPLTLVVIALTFLCAAIGSFCLVIIRDRDTFLLVSQSHTPSFCANLNRQTVFWDASRILRLFSITMFLNTAARP